MYFKEQVMTGRLAVPMFTVSICRTLHKRKFQTPFSNTLGKLLIKRVRFKIILSKLAGCVALVSSAGCHSEQVYFAVCFLYINPSLLWLGSALQFNLDYLYSKKRASTLSNKLKHVQPVKCKPRFTIIKDNKTSLSCPKCHIILFISIFHENSSIKLDISNLQKCKQALLRN